MPQFSRSTSDPLSSRHFFSRLMVAVMGFGMLLLLTGCGGGSPDSTTKKLMKAIQDNDVATVASMLPPDSLVPSDHPEALRFARAKQIVEQFLNHEGVSSYTVLDKDEQEIYGDIAEYEVEVKCVEEVEVPQTDGDPKKEKIELIVTVDLIQYKGRWRVEDVSSRRRVRARADNTPGG